MINTLFYISEDEFEADYRAEIYEQANKLAEDREWWNEPLWLVDKLRWPHHLTGETKLLREDPADPDGIPLLGKEIPYRDNALMGYIDLQHIIALLQQVSEQHEICWTLSESQSEGSIGQIKNGRTDDSLEKTLESIRTRWNFPESQLHDEDLHKRIRLKHTDEIEHEEAFELIPEYLPPEKEVE